MEQETQDAAVIEAGIGQIGALGIEALRKRWRLMSGATPPKGLTKDLIAQMIAYRIQCDAFGGLDRETVRLLDRLARGGKPQGLNRRLKPDTVLVREYQGERHTVTVVPGCPIGGGDAEHLTRYNLDATLKSALYPLTSECASWKNAT
jgi:hypothetical protein